MFEKFVSRENEIFTILEKINNAKIEFVMIGGYAVSAYRHRFSVDADIAIKKEDYEKVRKILEENKYEKITAKQLENIYSTKFERYEKKIELPVNVDLLIGGMGVRQTNAAFSFDFLNENSQKRKIIGTEKEIVAKVPDKELLIAMKIHAGRLTDFRDVVALCQGIDINKIKIFLDHGDKHKIKKHCEWLKKALTDPNFIGSFKGVFVEKGAVPNIKKVMELIDILVEK